MRNRMVIIINLRFTIFSVVGVKTFGSASSDLKRPISFPNYSDPGVANWSTGHDSVTMTPSIFKPALLGRHIEHVTSKNKLNVTLWLAYGCFGRSALSN